MLPIIYRDKAFVRNTYSYHKWRANPGDLVTYYLARDFKAQNVFEAVLSYDSNLRMTHSLEGVVEEFYEKDSEDSWEAVLSFSLTLVKEHEPDVTRQGYISKTISPDPTGGREKAGIHCQSHEPSHGAGVLNGDGGCLRGSC